MEKSLEQIQKENRKFILEATGEYKDELELLKQQAHQIYHEIISKSFNSIPLTLSRVLLAISKHGYYDDIYFGDLHGDSCETLEFDIKGVAFNLYKETLEEQTEETQRGINEFFND